MSSAQAGPPASPEGMPLSSMLAVDGRDVGMVLGVSRGPEIGAALRWLQGEVEINPELNTPAALTALLRFAAPQRTFHRTSDHGSGAVACEPRADRGW